MVILNEKSTKEELLYALKGVYESERLSNGIEYRRQGSLLYFQGSFESLPRTVAIPSIPSRAIVNFLHEGKSYCVIAEPNSGMVKSPEEIWNKACCIFATCIVNYQ